MKRKQVIYYVIAVLFLGIITGVLASFGSNLFLGVTVSTMFWAGMLTPML